MTEFILFLPKVKELLGKDRSNMTQMLLFPDIAQANANLWKLINILEFSMTLYPKDFLNVESLNFSRLSNFLKNLSSRIIGKTLFTEVLEGVSTICPEMSIINIRKLFSAIIGVFNIIYENSREQSRNILNDKLLSASEIEPFKKILNFIENDETLRNELSYSNLKHQTFNDILLLLKVIVLRTLTSLI